MLPFTNAMYEANTKQRDLGMLMNDNQDLCEQMGTIGLEKNIKEEMMTQQRIYQTLLWMYNESINN
uniref:Uncharacterized protein n=1 Tax=Pyramimonas orientalis virus TaxID=455367 RepID=A0A7M3UP78_POV01|nr:hypothetical protein HWQ62_00416 [Pyramimonas orientalis virus]